MNKKNNTRYKNTEKTIENNFLALLEVKDIRHITIKELCKISKINRSTFYAHYQDIYDLLDQIEEKLSKKLIRKFEENYHVNSDRKPKNYIKIFLEFVGENKIFYKNFVNSQQNFPIKKGFDELLNKFAIPYFHGLGINSEDEIIYRFVFMQAGFTMVLKRWLNDNCKDSPEKITDIILSCVFNEEHRDRFFVSEFKTN